MRYDLVIFDLDGTILDTLADLTEAANFALAQAGLPPHGADDVRRFIGGGVTNLIRRAVPEGTPQPVRDKVLSDFRARYSAHVNDLTLPFDGVPHMLKELKDAGVRLAVNSNKVDDASRALCEAHFGGVFDLVLGERPDLPRKPAPDGARFIMSALNAAPSRTLYVGDGDADIRTAENADIDCAWVSWGYRRREELEGLAIPRHFDAPAELERFILE